MHRIAACTAVCLTLGISAFAHAADLSREQAEMQRAIADAQKKQQSGQKYALQSFDPKLDQLLQSFSSAANNLVSCSRGKSAFASQFSAQMSQTTSLLGGVAQLLNNPALKALAGPAVSNIMPSATSTVNQLHSTCSTFNGATAGNAKYEQVSQVMRSVFSGGDLGPNSPAVRHAADVDMPARGGTPQALQAYLISQNGQVKKWYRDNYHLQ